ncbi:hypothetical protein AB0I28_14765 [Phytomonospora sp. NPDC050363]|uniref:hypothetical protein n=1 Tax=Phytomonospora sp. NPDC050363 TaxID=3155642 RepID=UPI003411D507
MRALGRLGDRIVARLVPSGIAKANPIWVYQYRCDGVRKQRRVCRDYDGEYLTCEPWVTIGSCGGV